MRSGSDDREKLNRTPQGRPGRPRRGRSARSRIRLAYSLFLILFTLFVLLDTFLIPRNIVRAGGKGGRLSDGGRAIVTENSYEDDNIRISITTRRVENTTVYIADVVLSDPSLLQAGLAGDSFGRNLAEVPSSIAKRNGAVFAINGDYYGFREKVYVLRNVIDEAVVTAQELEEEGAQQVFSFGPALVNRGEVRVVEGEEVERAQITNPRTAIGIIEPLHYCLVVSDGRTRESRGLSLYQLADLMQELGCDIAYNLDGGGSSTMWFNGRVLNKPTTYGDVFEERTISDIVYIGY